ncbi:MAG: manganese catalase family protein [Clostridia bacterium]|nr:manganese catalase family protein [Clostridia bacterium]
MARPLTVDKEFPTTEGLCPDAYSLAVISPAYASPTGELNAILQYFYHYFNFDKQCYKEYARDLEGIAIAEMLHLEILGKTIMALGAQPIYCQNPPTAFNFYSAKYVTYSRNLVNMIEDDIISERRAIASYSKMLTRLKDDKVKSIISRILEDEKLHLDKLNEILCGLKR